MPFAFQVDDARRPAGEYVIEKVDSLEPNLLKITLRHGVEEAFFLTSNASPLHSVREPELVFDRYGKQRFLHAIWLPNSSGAVVQVSPAELLTARTVALARVNRERVRKGRQEAAQERSAS